MYQQFAEELKKAVSASSVLIDEPMNRHTTFRIGGPADVFCMPESEEELRAAVLLCRDNDIPFYILGNGSNLLVADEGYRGVIIQLYKNFAQITIEPAAEKSIDRKSPDAEPAAGEIETASSTHVIAPPIHMIITAQAGAMLSAVSRRAAEASLTGLEFASGIPGTIGGAMVMNAGAYGGEMKQVTKSVRAMRVDGTFLDIPAEEMAFGYRTSRAQSEGLIILGCRMELQKGDLEKIKGRMEELRQQRTSKQPLDMPSAGSTFKRPTGYFAGKLIMDAGLRGYRVGDAMVSEKHCGFVVNAGSATAAQIRQLMKDVQKKVYEQFGVTLEREVKLLGFEEK